MIITKPAVLSDDLWTIYKRGSLDIERLLLNLGDRTNFHKLASAKAKGLEIMVLDKILAHLGISRSNSCILKTLI